MDFQAHIQDYLDGELTEQQHAELSTWLGQDEANREAFVRASMLDSHIHRQLTQSDLHQFLDQVDIHSLQSAMAQSTSSDSDAFVAMMGADPNQSTATQERNDITFRQSVGILTQAGTKFASKRLRQHAMTIALAAAVVLALTLVFVFRGGDEQLPASKFTQTPDETVTTAQAQTVATLTAIDGAQWGDTSAERALARGSELHPGTRLTLTAGFAEITTKRGAIAILEAPATIELLDNNALHLHTGKLVGICETDSSKGFLVRTPQMDVIDLGTRFGVDASEPDATEVHVFEGEVQAQMPRSNEPARRLSIGQAVRASVTANALIDITPRLETFAQAMGIQVLPGTGVGLAVGDTDPNWRIIAVDGKTLEQPVALSVSPDAHSTPYAGDDRLGRWIRYGGVLTRSVKQDRAVYTVQSEIVIPATADLGQMSLRVLGYLDDKIVGLRFNGQKVSKLSSPSRHVEPWHFSATLDELGLQPGSNTVTFDITNEPNTAMGLVVQWHLVAPNRKEDKTVE